MNQEDQGSNVRAVSVCEVVTGEQRKREDVAGGGDVVAEGAVIWWEQNYPHKQTGSLCVPSKPFPAAAQARGTRTAPLM